MNYINKTYIFITIASTIVFFLIQYLWIKETLSNSILVSIFVFILPLIIGIYRQKKSKN